MIARKAPKRKATLPGVTSKTHRHHVNYHTRRGLSIPKSKYFLPRARRTPGRSANRYEVNGNGYLG